MSTEAICESCGMPMRDPSEYGGGDTANRYCVHCTDAEGKLRSYEEALEGMKQLMIRNNGMAESEALQAAKEYMATMPAWASRTE
jgi:hypothetical protein